MKHFPLSSLALTLAFATGGVAQGQEAKGDLAAAGHDLALKICASCHVVANDQEAAPLLKPPAPSFSEIAARAGTTETFLQDFLGKPHGEARRSSKMPAFMLADFQIKQVVAYILSLKPEKERTEPR